MLVYVDQAQNRPFETTSILYAGLLIVVVEWRKSHAFHCLCEIVFCCSKFCQCLSAPIAVGQTKSSYNSIQHSLN